MVRPLALAAALALLVAGCGEAEDGGAPAQPGAGIDLTLRFDDGAGATATSRLRCSTGEQRAGGPLDGRAPAAALCGQARRLATLLTVAPAKDRICTEIFGGPQTIAVSGTLDGDAVERAFSRRNGCEIADYDTLLGGLPVAP